MSLALVVSEYQRMPFVFGSPQIEIRLEKSVPDDAQLGEHRAAENDGIDEGSTLDVFDDVRLASSDEHLPNGSNESWPQMSVVVALGEIGIRLTRR